ncbi:unnamed protein product [Oikopleura dioica]|uniref:Uncharacterized protein n=1 Tax=Oikopleura dioica TaxID=34765 RepID=E4YW57_OIKDI|nr:unnamed protein product [Oikopleura dioica]
MMEIIKKVLNLQIWKFRDSVIIFIVPLLFLPLIIIDGENDIPTTDDSGVVYSSKNVARFGYSLLVMAIYWITECLPLPVTAVLPYIFYPLLGLQSSGAVSINYMKNTNFLLLGSLMVAISIETSNLHSRLALLVLKIVGSSPRRLLLGFMLIGWFLSLWISNVAACAMTIPMAIAVIDELKTMEEHSQTGIANSAFDENDEERKVDETCFDDIEDKPKKEEKSRTRNIETAFLLAIPYSCHVGGVATLTGTAPNLLLNEYWAEQYPDSPITLSYAEWMGFGILYSFVLLLVFGLYMNLFFLGFRCETNKDKEEAVSKIINEKYNALGKMSMEEIMVLINFVALVLLWFFRAPGFINGWTILFPEPSFISDGVPAVFFGVLLFIIPAEKSGFWECPQKGTPSRSVHTWKNLAEKMPWGVLLLIGAGFAMADGSDVSGFSTWVARILANLVGGLENWAIILVVTIVVAFFTEICSNTAASSLFIPILGALAKELCVHPLRTPPTIIAKIDVFGTKILAKP